MTEPLEQEVPEQEIKQEPEATARKKRVTVADLANDFKTLEAFIDEEIIPAIDMQEGKIQALTAKGTTTVIEMADDITTRLEALETANGALVDAMRSHIEETANLAVTVDECENQVNEMMKIQAISRKLFTESELDFTTPPAQPAGGPEMECDIAVVASVCNTLADVLTVCRALREKPDMTDESKIKVLTVACWAADVDETIGLRIRAGIASIEK